MSLVRKITLLVLPAVALAFPLAGVSSAAPHPDHHEQFDHHEHFEHHDLFWHHDPIVNLRLAPIVAPAPIQLIYRVPTGQWCVFGSYDDAAVAQVAANSLQLQGYQVAFR